MREISDAEYELYLKLRKIVVHTHSDKYPGIYFICGESGDKDLDGLPERILICPSLGADIGSTVTYKKELRNA